MRGVLVDRETRTHGRDLEEHAARLAEVDRLEPEAVDHGRRPRPAADHALPPRDLLVIPRRPRDVVHRARAGHATLGGRGVEDVPAGAALAANGPRHATVLLETQRLLEKTAAAIGVCRVGAHLFEPLDREVLRDVGMRCRQRSVGGLDHPQLQPKAFGIREEQRGRRPALTAQAPLPEVEGGFGADPQNDAVDHPLAGAPWRRARVLEERQVHPRAARVVAVEEVIDGGIVLVHGLLDQAKAELSRVEVDVRLRVAGDRADVMYAFQFHCLTYATAGRTQNLTATAGPIVRCHGRGHDDEGRARSFGMGDPPRGLRNRFDDRSLLRGARFQVPAALPGHGRCASRRGSCVDRLPQRDVLRVRAAARSVLGRVGRALRPDPGHRPQRLRGDGRVRRALAVAEPVGGGIRAAARRVPARQHRRDADGAARGRAGRSCRLRDLAVRDIAFVGIRAGARCRRMGRRPRVPEPPHAVPSRFGHSLVAGLVILAFAREARRTVGPTGSAVTQAVQAVRLTLTTPITLAVFGVFGIVYFAYSMANPFLPLLVVRLHGTAGDIGLIFGATAVVGALLSPAAGAAGDRIGFKVVLIAAGALAAASLAELAWAPNFLWLAVGSTVLGAAAATAISMVFSLLATAVPEERRATTLNLVLLPIYIASIIGGVIGAVLVRESLNLVLITSAAVSLAAALLTTRLPSAGRRGRQA